MWCGKGEGGRTWNLNRRIPKTYVKFKLRDFKRKKNFTYCGTSMGLSDNRERNLRA